MITQQEFHGEESNQAPVSGSAHNALRVLLVEDQTLVCEGLEILLNLADDIRVVARAGDGIEALQRVQENLPDLVLLDIRMPKRGELKSCAR